MSRVALLIADFWEASGAGHTIVEAFKELSRRVIERGGKKIIVKLSEYDVRKIRQDTRCSCQVYDRGNPSQAIHAHQPVDVKTYTGDKVKLPAPEDIPGLELEVQNYHMPPVGTFHSKYMVVDRKVALLNSNNIQDRVSYHRVRARFLTDR